ncbi:unnamed protein product, partial [Mesorhabditis spiculigera]
MSLETLLGPAVAKMEEAFAEQDEEGYIQFYSPTACWVEVEEKKVHNGPEEIRALFRSWCTVGKWTTEVTNRQFSGGDDLICHTCTYRMFFANGGAFKGHSLQYWRRNADAEYQIEVEHSVTV